MKYVILILLSGLFVFCRSNRNLDSTVETHIESASTASSVQKDSTAAQTHHRDSTSDIAAERQYLRTTWYRPDGSIRKVQESGREAMRNSVAVRDTGSSAVHVSGNRTDSTWTLNRKILETQRLKEFTDSRPIQGSEWGWAIGAFTLIVVVFGYWEYRKNK